MPRSFSPELGVSQLLCCQRKQVDFLHEKGFLVAEHRDTYMDEVPKKIHKDPLPEGIRGGA